MVNVILKRWNFLKLEIEKKLLAIVLNNKERIEMFRRILSSLIILVMIAGCTMTRTTSELAMEKMKY